MRRRTLVLINTLATLCIILSLATFRQNNTEFFEEDTDVHYALPPPSASWRTDPIPKIIHQTAPADTNKWPDEWKECQESWKKHFPDYQYRLWTDEDIDDFIKTSYPAFYDMFKSYDRHIKRVDAFRYFVLYEFGGIYADMDYLCLKNFEHLLPVGKVSCNEAGVDVYQNALMASPAKHPFWHHVFQELYTNPDHHDVVIATGPHVLFRAHERAINGDELVHQISAGNVYRCDHSNDDCYAYHIETGVWKT